MRGLAKAVGRRAHEAKRGQWDGFGVGVLPFERGVGFLLKGLWDCVLVLYFILFLCLVFGSGLFLFLVLFASGVVFFSFFVGGGLGVLNALFLVWGG